MSYTGGSSAGSPLDEIEELVAYILGKANITNVGMGKTQEILDFIHEGVE